MAYRVDFSELRRNLESYKVELRANSREILGIGLVNFVQWAARYTPPDMGKKTISPERYMRVVLYLANEVRREGNRDRARDIEMLRAGFRFKMYKKIPGVRRMRPEYFIKLNAEQRRMMKITTRGLLRYSLGDSLERGGLKMPSNVRSIGAKSRYLRTLPPSSRFSFHNTLDGGLALRYENRRIEARDSYWAIAKRNGEKHAQDAMNRAWNRVLKKRRIV